MEKELKYKAFSGTVETKAESEDGRLHIKFYGAGFNNVDSWGDIIAPGAFDAFLASENAERMKLCNQHNLAEVIGVITSKGTDANGLLIEADILPTAAGRDVQVLIKAGAINEFSIGYFADEYHFEKREGYDTEIRILDAITVIEVSPVTRAANPRAVLLDAKSDDGRRALSVMADADLEELHHATGEEIARRVLSRI